MRMFRCPLLLVCWAVWLPLIVGGKQSERYLPFRKVCPVKAASTDCARLPRILFDLSGGAQQNNGDDRPRDERRREDDRYHDRRHRGPPPNRRPPKKQSNILGRLAKGSLSLTTQAVTASARQSGKLAYWAVRPKRVEWSELVGLWRLDQSLDDNPEVVVATLELTPQQSVIVGPQQEEEGRGRRVHFVKASRMGASARIEFTTPSLLLGDDADSPSTKKREQGSRRVFFLYKAYVHRKVADPSVIKLKGKIYRIEQSSGWRGGQEKKILAGTFVARRRLKFDDDQAPDGEDEDWGSDEADLDDDEVESETSEEGDSTVDAKGGYTDDLSGEEVDEWEEVQYDYDEEEY